MSSALTAKPARDVVRCPSRCSRRRSSWLPGTTWSARAPPGPGALLPALSTAGRSRLCVLCCTVSFCLSALLHNAVASVQLGGERA